MNYQREPGVTSSGQAFGCHLSLDDFQSLLNTSAGPLTCKDSSAWRPDNPLLGHCAVAALAAHRVFKGRILRIPLDGTPFSEWRSHYFNSMRDFTAAQFGSWRPDYVTSQTERAPLELAKDPDTAARTGRLWLNLAQNAGTSISQLEGLSEDPIFLRCLGLAIASHDCQAAVIADKRQELTFWAAGGEARTNAVTQAEQCGATLAGAAVYSIHLSSEMLPVWEITLPTSPLH